MPVLDTAKSPATAQNVDTNVRERKKESVFERLFPKKASEWLAVTLARAEGIPSPTLLVRARIEWAIGQCISEGKVFVFEKYDWDREDPITMKMRALVSIDGRGRDDAQGIERPIFWREEAEEEEGGGLLSGFLHRRKKG